MHITSKMQLLQVSIIIPFYNAASTLRRALLSVTAQSYQNLSLILIDDGSTDSFLDVITETFPNFDSKKFNCNKIYNYTQILNKNCNFQQNGSELSKIKSENEPNITQNSSDFVNFSPQNPPIQSQSCASYPNFRHIVFKHNNIQIFLCSIPHRGTLYARMLATSLAYDYALFLDADDELTGDFIGRAVEKMEREKIDTLCFNSIDSKDRQIVNFTMNASEIAQVATGEKLLKLRNDNKLIFNVLWGKMYKADVLKNAVRMVNILGGNEIVYAEDTLIISAIDQQDYSLGGLDVVGYIYHNQHRKKTKNEKSKKMEKVSRDSFFVRQNVYINEEYLQAFEPMRANEMITFKVDNISVSSCEELIVSVRNLVQMQYGYDFMKKFKEYFENKEILEFTNSCYLQSNGRWKQLDNQTDQQLNPNDLANNLVQSKNGQYISCWNGKTKEEYSNLNISIESTLEIVEQIWNDKNNGQQIKSNVDCARQEDNISEISYLIFTTNISNSQDLTTIFHNFIVKTKIQSKATVVCFNNCFVDKEEEKICRNMDYNVKMIINENNPNLSYSLVTRCVQKDEFNIVVKKLKNAQKVYISKKSKEFALESLLLYLLKVKHKILD